VAASHRRRESRQEPRPVSWDCTSPIPSRRSQGRAHLSARGGRSRLGMPGRGSQASRPRAVAGSTPVVHPLIYEYAWGNNERRAELKGRRCVVEARGRLNTVLIRFLDTNERVTTSRHALRPATQTQQLPLRW
jgi:hypothetical protein